MAKRLNNQSTVGDVLKQIQVNKLQSGMDQIDVKDAWCNLMGNGVNSYTKMLC
jgi:Tfp pilus tip-associated adhesin PilY1